MSSKGFIAANPKSAAVSGHRVQIRTSGREFCEIFQSLGPDEIADFLRTLSASDNPELVTECFSILSQFHNEE